MCGGSFELVLLKKSVASVALMAIIDQFIKLILIRYVFPTNESIIWCSFADCDSKAGFALQQFSGLWKIKFGC